MNAVSSTVVRMFLLALAVQMVLTSYPVFADEGETTKTLDSVALGGGTSNSGDTPQPDLFTGAMSYQIPIEVPPGRNGMDPGLALTYSSRNSNGWVGMGWDLEVGAIERSTRRGVDYAKSDYVLRRAGSVSELFFVDPIEYRLKVDGFANSATQLEG